MKWFFWHGIWFTRYTTCCSIVTVFCTTDIREYRRGCYDMLRVLQDAPIVAVFQLYFEEKIADSTEMVVMWLMAYKMYQCFSVGTVFLSKYSRQYRNSYFDMTRGLHGVSVVVKPRGETAGGLMWSIEIGSDQLSGGLASIRHSDQPQWTRNWNSYLTGCTVSRDRHSHWGIKAKNLCSQWERRDDKV